MINAIIIDDEIAAVNVIRELINELMDDVIVDAVAMNGIEAIRAIVKNNPDLLFMDINLPYINGIEIIQRLQAKDHQVIFTTGTPQYALNAIKLEAVDYLLKPIDPSDFIIAVEKARKRIDNKKEKSTGKIQLHTLNDISYVREENILFITGMGSYSTVHTKSGERIVVSKSIGQMEQKVSKHLFFRCHSSYLVNIVEISKFTSKDGPQLIMNDGSVVDVSRRNKEGLMKRLNETSR